MYIIINQNINSLIIKINIMRAEKCLLGYYPTTLLCKAFNSVVKTVVTPLLNCQLLPAYYRVLPLQGNYPKNAYKTLVVNKLFKSYR